jgi:hypothetical protein
MSRMETVCIGCMTPVVPNDAPGPAADGGAICPKCGPRESHQLVRRPVTEGSR